jgi:hypothetical protein
MEDLAKLTDDELNELLNKVQAELSKRANVVKTASPRAQVISVGGIPSKEVMGKL